jgi:hypothetical protein
MVIGSALAGAVGFAVVALVMSRVDSGFHPFIDQSACNEIAAAVLLEFAGANAREHPPFVLRVLDAPPSSALLATLKQGGLQPLSLAKDTTESPYTVFVRQLVSWLPGRATVRVGVWSNIDAVEKSYSVVKRDGGWKVDGSHAVKPLR